MAKDIKYYVYAHSIDGMYFYVGYSHVKQRRNNTYGVQYERAYTVIPQKKYWHEYRNGREHDVEIIKHFDTQKEAYDYETYLIKHLISKGHPLVNKNKTKEILQFNIFGDLVKKHNTSVDAAKEVNVVPNSIIKCINKPYTSMCDGYIFTYDEKRRFDFIMSVPLIVKLDNLGSVKDIYLNSKHACIENNLRSTTSIRNAVNENRIAAGHHYAKMFYRDIPNSLIKETFKSKINTDTQKYAAFFHRDFSRILF